MTITPNHSSAVALRFEIIKRVTPGFRHRMLGRMQPIALLSHLMGKKIQAGQIESGFLLKRLQELKESLNAATDATIDLFSWLNPDENSLQPLSEIVEECLDLLKMDIYTSNISLCNNVRSTALVKVSVVRNVFICCLLTYIDTVDKASQLMISDREDAEGLALELTISELPSRENKVVNGSAVFMQWDNISLISGGATVKKEAQQILISRIT
ncbi:MAG TPA: hypothetical protein VK953_00160 [Methylophilus sp.]|nr:hypothetical protein [Methylophilus sp.]